MIPFVKGDRVVIIKEYAKGLFKKRPGTVLRTGQRGAEVLCDDGDTLWQRVGQLTPEVAPADPGSAPVTGRRLNHKKRRGAGPSSSPPPAPPSRPGTATAPEASTEAIETDAQPLPTEPSRAPTVTAAVTEAVTAAVTAEAATPVVEVHDHARRLLEEAGDPLALWEALGREILRSAEGSLAEADAALTQAAENTRVARALWEEEQLREEALRRRREDLRQQVEALRSRCGPERAT